MSKGNKISFGGITDAIGKVDVRANIVVDRQRCRHGDEVGTGVVTVKRPQVGVTMAGASENRLVGGCVVDGDRGGMEDDMVAGVADSGDGEQGMRQGWDDVAAASGWSEHGKIDVGRMRGGTRLGGVGKGNKDRLGGWTNIGDWSISGKVVARCARVDKDGGTTSDCVVVFV